MRNHPSKVLDPKQTVEVEVEVNDDAMKFAERYKDLSQAPVLMAICNKHLRDAGAKIFIERMQKDRIFYRSVGKTKWDVVLENIAVKALIPEKV